MGRIAGYGRTLALTASAVVVGIGVSSVVSAATITNTGPNSKNTITEKFKNTCSVRNKNNVKVNNTTNQSGYSGDATVGSTGWGGWSTLDPKLAQDRGTSHDDWLGNVDDWMAQRGGNDWNSAGDNLDWAPGGDDWASYDPLSWQSNGQSFDNWRNGARGFLDRHDPEWRDGWQGGGSGGNTIGGSASTGNVTNHNNTDLSVGISNNGLEACVPSQFVAPPRFVSKEEESRNQAQLERERAINAREFTSPSVPGRGVGAMGGVGGFGAVGVPGRSAVARNVPAAVSSAAASSSAARAAKAAQAAVVAKAQQQKAVIANTGPNSSNKISTEVNNKVSIENKNNVKVTNTTNQSGYSGDATVKGNTNGGGAGTGNLGNGNSTGGDIAVGN